MIDPRLIDRLSDPDAERRKQAVVAIARIKEYAALQYLATVYREDSDPQVRELARKGGQFLRQHVTPPPPGAAVDRPKRRTGPEERSAGQMRQILLGSLGVGGIVLLVSLVLPWIQIDLSFFNLKINGLDLIERIEEVSGSTDPLAYTILFVPLVGAAQILLAGYFLAQRTKPDVWYWRQAMGSGALALAPVAWLYWNLSTDNSGLSPTSFLGPGFWLCLVLGLLVAGMGYLGMMVSE